MKKPGLRILIVDDDEWLVNQQVSLLEKSSYQVAFCHDAWSAIDLIDDFKPNLLVLDVLLPANTVFNLIHELQSYQDTSKIPIIICSNIASQLSIDDLKDYGVKLILDKTIMQPEDLLVAIKRLF